MKLKVLQERLKAHKNNKEFIGKLKKDLKIHEDKMKEEEKFLVDTMLELNLLKLAIENVGSFSVSSRTNFFYPTEIRKRKEFDAFVNKNLGKDYLIQKKSLSMSAVTKLYEEFYDSSLLKEGENIPGVESFQVNYKLSITKK